MEVNGKRGKYTSRLSQAAKDSTVLIIIFLSLFVGLFIYIGFRFMKEDPVILVIMLFFVTILTGLIFFIVKETKKRTSIVSDSELTDTGYVTTFIDTKTNKSIKVEVLYTDMEKCLLSPHSVVRPSATNSFETYYNKHITFNILFRTSKGNMEL